MAIEDDAEWMQRLPLWHEDALRVYVHASARENCHPKDTPESTLLWARYRKGLDIGCMGKHVVHGHTPYDEPEILTHRTNLDCGAVFTGVLAMGFFDNKTPGPLSIIYVKPE
jgi:serine/threonine protein phosphatase 1